MPRTLAAVALLSLIAAGVTPAAASGQDRFRIRDRVGPTEVEETIAVYIDHTLVGTFRLTPAHPTDQLDIAVPAADSHSYALCGKVITRTKQGGRVVHQVDTSGDLPDAQGRIYEALTRNFQTYFVEDETVGRRPSAVRIRQGRACTPVTS